MSTEAPPASVEASPSSAPVATGKYHVLTELGRGGMAVVQAAVARGMGGFAKLVVLKKPRPELGDESGALQTFLNEARISARMNHPNVVQVYEVFEEQGLPVIVMEYLDGHSLAALLRIHATNPTSSVETVLGVLCRALEGLHYAHSLADFDGTPMNLIHRDVTPHNIMVTYDGQVKLLDFGIAKLESLAGETKTGVIKGKLGYMPPEQVEGRPLDCRADVFAIGAMIWEVVARARMWGDQAEAAVIKRLVLEDLPSLGAAVPDADPQIVRICTKATAPDRQHRYSSALELLDDLRGYLAARGGVPTDPAIAQWVTRLSVGLEDRARKRIGKKLAQYSQMTNKSLAEFSFAGSFDTEPEGTGSRARAKVDTGTSRGYAAETLSRALGARSGRWAAIAAASVALGVLVVWRITSGGEDAPASTPVPHAAEAPIGVGSEPPRAVEPQPAAAPEVRVQIRAEPREAVLSLDGERLSGNPYIATLPRDGSSHRLTIVADGFEPVERTLYFDRDLDVDVTLARSNTKAASATDGPVASRSEVAQRVSNALNRPRPRASAPAPRPQPPPPAPAPPPRPAATQPTVSCNPPYTLDASGVKRYKRECFGK